MRLGFGREAPQECQAESDVELAEEVERTGKIVLRHGQKLVAHRDPVPDQLLVGKHVHQ